MARDITTEQQVLAPDELAAKVRELISDSAEWVTRIRLDPEGRWYERIHLDDDFEVWLISWLPGQSTGFHDHGGATGAFGVVWGELREHVVDGTGTQEQAGKVTAGQVRAFGPRYVHDVRNTAAGSVAVSVHAYSPPLSAMTRYALTPDGLVVTATEDESNW